MAWPTYTFEIEFSSGSWTNVTADVRSRDGVTINRGSSRLAGPIPQAQAGTLKLALNNRTRAYDPVAVSTVRPRKRIRVKATWASVTYPLFFGYIDSWEPGYSLDGNDSITRVVASDAIKTIARYDAKPLATAVGDDEGAASRVARILDTVGWPNGDRSIIGGLSRFGATTHDDNAWNELLQVSLVEMGDLWVDPEGKVTFRGRDTLRTAAAAGAVCTFGDSGVELPYRDVRVSIDDSQIVNYASIGREGGTEQTASDATSITAYQTLTYRQTGLLMYPGENEAKALAEAIVALAKDPDIRLDPLEVVGGSDDNLWPQILGLDIGDVVTVKRRPVGGGSTISLDQFVRGITHVFTLTTWRTVYALQNVTRYVLPGSVWTLDDAGTLDQLDAGRILIY